MNIMIMWMKEWVEIYTFCKTCASTLTVKRIFSGIQNPLQIFSSVAICGFKRDQMTGAEAFVEQYQARWSIETGYRCVESMRPRTTSREESVRVLLLFAPIILFNAWILASHLLQRDNPGKAQTEMTFKMLLEFFMLLVREKTCRSLLVP